jgi:hypothetical protein
MDHAVSLVQAYLQLNGYFTSAEYPILASAGRSGFRTLTDIDILAFRFPTPAGAPTGKRDGPQSLDVSDLDPGLGITSDAIDLIIGEVKEGRVGINSGSREPDVLKAVISRFGNTDEDDDRVVRDLLARGVATLPSGYVIRLVAFGAFPPGSEVPPCRIVSLGHVLNFLQNYVRKHWSMLRHCQLKDPAFGFLMTLEKARRGGAGRRGEEGVELVPAAGEPRIRRGPPPATAVVSAERDEHEHEHHHEHHHDDDERQSHAYAAQPDEPPKPAHGEVTTPVAGAQAGAHIAPHAEPPHAIQRPLSARTPIARPGAPRHRRRTR